jgi:hypothetical protein
MEIFKIGDNDYTKHIVVPSYQVNRVRKTKEWTDSNGTIHRQLIRNKVTGKFNMRFDDASQLDAFLDDVEAHRDATNETVTVVVYLNNFHNIATINAFVSFDDLQNERPLMGRASVNGFSVTIEER